jgi:hypothetical protein
MKEPEVAVLVINYNGKHFLKACLESLEKQTYKNYQVYIVDNASADGSIEYVKQHFPWVKTIVFSENLGFAKAYNEATRMINADYAVFLNNDTKVDANWLSELVKSALEDESVVVVGSKILFYDRPNILQHAGAKITPIGGGVDVGQYELDEEKYNKREFAGAVCGAAMLVRKYEFLKLGGFDDDLFAYFEDTDFCWRAWLHGFKVIYVPTAVVYHIFGGSWGPRNNPNRLFLGQRNRLIGMIKNLELKNLCEAIPISLSYDVLRSLILIGRRNARGFFALVKANFWVMINLRKILMKRRIVQSYKKIPDRYLKEKSLMATFKEAIHEYLRLSKLNFNTS